MKSNGTTTKKDARGFTLIELLVVIAIIGLLSSVVLASLNSARAKARDAKRKSDITEIRTALELYASDNNGRYPAVSGWSGICTTYNFQGLGGTTGATGYIPNLAPTYIPALPADPKASTGFCYIYNSDGIDYEMMAYGTPESLQGSTPMPRACYPAENDFAVWSAGVATKCF